MQLPQPPQQVNGQPQPDVAWFKDGVEVVRSYKVQMVVNQEGEHSLVIQEVAEKDGGVYTCRASNRAGEATKDVLLVVQGEWVLVGGCLGVEWVGGYWWVE